jgi:hypothetical protein
MIASEELSQQENPPRLAAIVATGYGGRRAWRY